MAQVIVGAPLHLSRRMGNTYVWVRRPIRQVQVQTHNVAHLLNEEGIRRQFEHFSTVGLQSKSPPDTADGIMAQAAAVDRVLQWASYLGVVSSVNVITCSTLSSVTARSRPLRGSSDRPSSLSSKNRERHFPHRLVGHPRVGSHRPPLADCCGPWHSP